MKDHIAVLIPCFNEVHAIANVVRDMSEAIPGCNVYVYDNNSTDGTAQAARTAGAVVRFEHMQGKGNVLRRMFREVDADCYVMIDGDGTYPAEAARELVRLVLEEGAEMAVGDRLEGNYDEANKRPFHSFGNRLMRLIAKICFDCNVPDMLTGLRAFSPLFVKTFPALSDGFELETEMTMHALDKRMRIMSIPIEYRERCAGSVSKLNTIRDGIRVIGVALRLIKNYRPMRFFGAMALASLTIALILFIPVFSVYLDTGLVPRIPTLITSVAFGIVGAICLSNGISLENLANFERRQFEIHLNMFTSMIFDRDKSK